MSKIREGIMMMFEDGNIKFKDRQFAGSKYRGFKTLRIMSRRDLINFLHLFDDKNFDVYGSDSYSWTLYPEHDLSCDDAISYADSRRDTSTMTMRSKVCIEMDEGKDIVRVSYSAYKGRTYFNIKDVSVEELEEALSTISARESKKIAEDTSINLTRTTDSNKFPEVNGESLVYEDKNTGNYVLITSSDNNDDDLMVIVCNYDEGTEDSIVVAREIKKSDYNGSHYVQEAAEREARYIIRSGYLNNALGLLKDNPRLYTRIN